MFCIRLNGNIVVETSGIFYYLRCIRSKFVFCVASTTSRLAKSSWELPLAGGAMCKLRGYRTVELLLALRPKTLLIVDGGGACILMYERAASYAC